MRRETDRHLSEQATAFIAGRAAAKSSEVKHQGASG
jgi:hypothetical protein